MDQLLSELQIAFESEENLVFDDLICQIEIAKRKVESSDFPAWKQRLEKMAQLRIRSSNTLRRGDLDTWLSANAFVEEQVRKRQLPTWSDICCINAIITKSNEAAVVREHPIYLGPFAASSPEKLNEHIRFFENNILCFKQGQRHELIYAALMQYWIVSIHPFRDANGRTAVLVADWIHLYFGFFPQVFESQIDAVIGHFAGRSTTATPARAVYKVLKNTLHSYQTFLS